MTVFQDFKDRWSGLVQRRQPWMGYWQQLADVLLPNRADFTSSSGEGTPRGADIYDGTPRLALRDLASTLDGLMKPKTSNWFDGQVDDDLADDDTVKLWLETVRERMWKAIYRPDARFIQRSGETDLALACFGWGVLWIGQNRKRDGLLFRSFHNAQVAVGENEDGIIDQVGVEETMTPRQAEMTYLKNKKPPSRLLMEALKDSKRIETDRFNFVQIVLPQEDRDTSKIGVRGMPFASVLMDIRSEEIIAETGFEEFPVAVPRWDTAPGEIYARSPGMMALPDSRTLQAMGKTLLVAGQRAVDPPIWVGNDSVMSPLRTFPGGITVLDLSDQQGGQTPIGAFPVSANIPLGVDMQRDMRANVEKAFFKNVFNLPVPGPTMTATEIFERKDEFIRTLGPVFGRLEPDYIGHVVERSFGIMERAGAFPPRPDALQNRKVTFKFQSPLQQARKQIEIAGLARAIEVLTPFAAVQPEIMDNFDGDAIARDIPDSLGMPTKWLRPVDKVQEVRQKNQQQQQDAQISQTAEPISKAIKNAAETIPAAPVPA